MDMPQARSTPLWHPRAWPAPVVNGLSVGVGLLLMTGVLGVTAGAPAAIAASSGAAATSVADTVCTPRDKPHQMVPAVIGCILVSMLVGLLHAHAWPLSLAGLGVIFASIFWMAWGKRGGPLTFVNVLTLVFQMAAWHQVPTGGGALPLFEHLVWVAVGAAGIALWSGLTAVVLARRYRELAMAEALDALSRLMHHQSRWTLEAARHDHPDAATAALLALIRAQASLPETLQAARDLIYSQAAPEGLPRHTRECIEALAQAVRLRDVLMGCQVDLESTPPGPASLAAIERLGQLLAQEAERVAGCAQAWRGQGPQPVPAISAWDTELDQQAVMAGSSWADLSLREALVRRIQHLSWVIDALDAATPFGHGGSGLDASTRIPSPLPPVDVHGQADLLQAMTSTPAWPLHALRAQWRLSSPVLRYAARTTAACACALALGHVLPWASHPHWILLTVAVIMRGSLDQTLMRLNARILGTLLGCLIAGTLVMLMPAPLGLMLVLGLAVSLAHGFVLIDYRVTSASGAVLALLQAHMLAHGHGSVWLDVAERLADTLTGAALAWAFSHIWPNWERLTLPRLVGRLLECLARDATHALSLWPGSLQSTAADAPSQPRPHHLDRHLARRDTQEVLALLTQALVRMDKEPMRARAIAPEVEHLLLHCHRLTSLLAGIRGLMALKQAQIAPDVALPVLARTHRALLLAFRDTRPDTSAPPTQPSTAPMPLGGRDLRQGAPAASSPFDDDLPPTEVDAVGGRDAASTTAWLLHRLGQVREATQHVADAARPLRALREPA